MNPVELPEYYSTTELAAMSHDELNAAQANGFRKDLPVPPPSLPQARPAAEVWGADQSYDFTCPSGATCRMRKLAPERLVETGLLSKLTRLPGLAQELVDKAEGKPPARAADDAEGMKSVLAVMQEIIPMIVVEPHVVKDPDPSMERVTGTIYVSSIDLMDRLAIMNKALEGVTKLDSFRAEP